MIPMMYMELIDDEEDKKAFEKLYKKHRNKAFLVAMDCLNNIALAEECVSETFLSIAKNFQTVNKLESNKQIKYIVISIRNTAKDALKKEKINLNTEEYNDENYYLEDSYSEFDIIAWRSCISQLSQTDKDILYLRCILNLDYKEISKILGISQGAARARAFAAKENLKKLLEKEDS